MINRDGQWWRGSAPRDIEEYLRDFTADQYPIKAFRLAACKCGSETFALDADDTEGAAKRTCTACGSEHLICDSADYWPDAEPERCACPCGAEEMNVGVGFAIYAESSDVKWLYVGCRCVACGVLGCYTDWKIAYGPSHDLLEKV